MVHSRYLLLLFIYMFSRASCDPLLKHGAAIDKIFTSDNTSATLEKNITDFLNETELEQMDVFDRILKINSYEHVAEKLLEGDIVRPTFRNANGERWFKSGDGLVRVPYTIASDYNSTHRREILSAIEVFREHTCIRFIPKESNHQTYVSIENQFGCSSAVGRGRLNQVLSLAIPHCVFKGIIIHELMHAVGFEHEQSRSDRDDYVRINLQNSRGSVLNFLKHRTTQNLVVYDYGSIMHYGKYAFSKQPFLETVEVYPRRNPKPNIGQRNQISPYDIEELKYYYDCGSGTYNRCGRDFVGRKTGTFQSPNFPKPYPLESHCTWKITASKGKFTRLGLLDIDLKVSKLCEEDAILVHDGENAGSPAYAPVCGNRAIVQFTSTDRSLFVIFRSNGIRSNKNGFRAKFIEVNAKGTPPSSAVRRERRIPKIRRIVESFSCNFDSNLCFMTQDKIDDLDYILRRDPTPSSGTGPSSDHTSGNGNFIYLEASGADIGDKGIIRTPWFDRKSSFCVTFSYHMFGSGMGGLRLYAYEKRRSSNIGNENVLWEALRNQGNEWKTETVTYRAGGDIESVQFYWEGIIYLETSDIALDDIDISSGVCVIAPTEPETVYSNTRCNFEPGFCQFKQSRADSFDWTRLRSATPTELTGPSSDHTTGTGYYIYAHANSGGQGNRAVLESPALTPGQHCLNMWYHMNGINMGTLTVYQQFRATQIKLAEITGTQGNQWKNLRININSQLSARNNPGRSKRSTSQERSDPGFTKRIVKRNAVGRSTTFIKVYIEATIGNGSRSDIAIDDIVISSSRCTGSTTAGVAPLPNRFSCNFENGEKLCGMEQLVQDKFDWTRHKGPTTSRGTGPESDNTLKTAEGYYLYMEASGRELFDYAQLATPKLRPGRYCVEFDYHMYGRSIGELLVSSFETPANTSIERWNKQGDQGNQWHQASFSVEAGPNSRSIEFRIRGILGASYTSDIAIDNINIVRGVCGPKITTPAPSTMPQTITKRLIFSKSFYPVNPNAPTATPKTKNTETASSSSTNTAAVPPPPSTNTKIYSGMPLCNFEDKPQQTPSPSTANIPGASSNDLGEYIYPDSIANNYLCGWRQMSSDHLDWQRIRGATPSSNTGPSRDKTTGNGYYMYIETTNNSPGANAFLQTYFMPSTEYCVDFSYHMYGNSVGNLSLRTIQATDNGERFRPYLQTFSGNKGNSWRKARIDFSPPRNSSIVAFRLEGVVGNGGRGDIAVDDVAIVPGRCDACQAPTHQYRINSGNLQRFSTGCVHTGLFWVRCCSKSRTKFVYRQVSNCNSDMFRPIRLNWYCRNY